MTDATTYEPGHPISLVLALLDQRWPPIGALDDSPSGDVLAKLASDPRYLASIHRVNSGDRFPVAEPNGK
jgi:hypothetical protein